MPLQRVRCGTQKPIWSLDPNLKTLKNKAKFWLKVWNECDRPPCGIVSDLKRKTRREYKKYLKSMRYRGMDFPVSKREWRKVINSESIRSDVPNSDCLPASAWHDHYSSIFSNVNYRVHSLYSHSLSAIFSTPLSQRLCVPISLSSVVEAIKKLKSDNVDNDGISRFHLLLDCSPLIDHIHLLLQMCICTSSVPESFLCGTVSSILKKGNSPFICSSYRPITVSCTFSKVLEHVLLPFVTNNMLERDNQFGFKPGVGCQHAHRVLSSLLLENSSKGRSIYLCTLDLSKAFDSVCHSQLFSALRGYGVNLSVILLLRYWYSNSFLRLKSVPASNIKLKRGLRQGGVLSPTLFNLCISGVLAKISATYLSGFSDVSYLAYADDLLLISRTKTGLSNMVSRVATSFSDIGLSLNVDKCKFLSFNNISSTSLRCSGFTIPLVDSLRWLGISITNSLPSLRQRTVSDINMKIKLGYAKIVANRGKYNKLALAKLYSTFCDHSILFASGIFLLLKKTELKRIRINYFRFCKFLLFLPPWTKNRVIINKFLVPNITEKLEALHRKLSNTACIRFSPHHHLIRFFQS